MNDPTYNGPYLVWLITGLFKPAERRAGGENPYPPKVYSCGRAAAAFQFVLDHGLGGDMQRSAQQKKTWTVGVVPHNAEPGTPVVVFRINLSMTLEQVHPTTTEEAP